LGEVIRRCKEASKHERPLAHARILKLNDNDYGGFMHHIKLARVEDIHVQVGSTYTVCLSMKHFCDDHG